MKASDSVLLVKEHCKIKNVQERKCAALGNFDDNAENNRFWNYVDTTLNFQPKTVNVRN